MDFLPSKKDSEDMDDSFDEADAALVLTSISCSPPTACGFLKNELSHPNSHHMPQLSCSLPSNIVSSELLKNASKADIQNKVYQCLWKQPKCTFTTASHEEIGQHVRNVHLSNGRLLRDRRTNGETATQDMMHTDVNDCNNICEEDFYYTEIEADVVESVVHSFRHLQTSSPPDVLVTSSPANDSKGIIAKGAFPLMLQQHSPDSAYGSVPVGQMTPDHDYQRKSGTIPTPAVPLPGIQNPDASESSLFSQSFPAARPLSFLSMAPIGMGLPNADAPIPEANFNRVVPECVANASSLGAAFLSVLQRFGQNNLCETNPSSVDLSSSLPSNWPFVLPAQSSLLPSGAPSTSPPHTTNIFQTHSGGGGVPFHVIASAAANVSAGSDPNINSLCLSSSPGSTNSGGTNSPPPQSMAGSLPSASVLKHRRIRSDVKKCRKVYGVEKRDMWCTQCRWKKACTRFME